MFKIIFKVLYLHMGGAYRDILVDINIRMIFQCIKQF